MASPLTPTERKGAGRREEGKERDGESWAKRLFLEADGAELKPQAGFG